MVYVVSETTDLNAKSLSAGDVCFQANAWLHVFQFHQIKSKASSISTRVVQWKPHSEGWLKVDFDGTFSSSNNFGGVGIIIRD